MNDENVRSGNEKSRYPRSNEVTIAGRPQPDIEPGASIGTGTDIWPFTTIRDRVHIGKGCHIGRYVVIDNDVWIGDRCKIEDGAKIYGPARLRDDVFIGPGVVIANDRYPRANFTMAGERPTTILEIGCSIGTNAVVMPGLTIGASAMVGASTVVLRNVWPGETVVGNPARVVR